MIMKRIIYAALTFAAIAVAVPQAASANTAWDAGHARRAQALRE